LKKIIILVLLVMLLSFPVYAQESIQTDTPAELLQLWEQLIPRMREAECYPYVQLKQGDRGYEVQFLQTRLTELLYYGKAIDPQFGRGTLAAMKMFERVHGLPVNGIASVEDQKLLFSTTAKINTGTPVGPVTGKTKSPGNNPLPSKTKTPDNKKVPPTSDTKTNPTVKD